MRCLRISRGLPGMELCRVGIASCAIGTVARITLLKLESGPAEGGNRPLVVGTTSARPFGPTRSPDGLFLLSAASRSFGGGADPHFRSLALDRRMLRLQDGDWQDLEQFRGCQPRSDHGLAGRQQGADAGKTFSQHRCIPSLTRRPSPALLRRAAEEPPGHDNYGVSLAHAR